MLRQAQRACRRFSRGLEGRYHQIIDWQQHSCSNERINQVQADISCRLFRPCVYHDILASQRLSSHVMTFVMQNTIAKNITAKAQA